MSEKINTEIERNVRNNTSWENLPVHIKQVLGNTSLEYDRFVFRYSLRNQLRFRGNLVRKIFKREERYYELLVEKSINNLCLFPYHLSDIVTKGLRVTPFNYYIEVICNFLKNEKSYDSLPNFTAADCLRVLGIGRNEYLSLASQLKTNSSKLFRRPNPKQFLPKFPVKINIEPWWKIEVGYVLESDIKYVSEAEKNVIDDLIDSGPQTVGECDYNVVHDLYRKGLVYLDVPISGDDKICIPPLRNFVMNRLSGDYFENLLYKIFVSADEHMTICELAKVLQIDLETVKYAVSLICRLGFAKKKSVDIKKSCLHESWKNREDVTMSCPLNYNALLMHSSNTSLGNSLISGTQTSPKPTLKTANSIEYISSDGNTSDFSFTNLPVPSNHELKTNKDNSENDLSSEIEEIGETKPPNYVKPLQSIPKSGKRVGFLFDSTLTAFLMMGNLSPGLKNHAVTMFEVGKLCEESMDTFLAELEKVSLLDAEGEGEVSRYFAHAVILRSTIIALRNAFENGLDLLRLECLESLDYKTRDRLLEKKYKFIISASPLIGLLSHSFTIPFFGQFYRSSQTSLIWSKFFYYHISGYGPPGLFLSKGTILKSLPRLFLGYGKLLVTTMHTDPYVISTENFHNINDQLKNDCVLIQGYGIRQNGEVRFEAFPFDLKDSLKSHWAHHKAVEKLKEHLDLDHNCGYITFVNTGVPDIGCENYDVNVRLTRSKTKRKKSLPNNIREENEYLNVQNEPNHSSVPSTPVLADLSSPMDYFEVTSFNRNKPKIDHLKTPDENYFAITPQNSSPSNVFRSEDCNELLATVLDNLNLTHCDADNDSKKDDVNSMEKLEEINLQEQSSVNDDEDTISESLPKNDACNSEMWTLLDVNFGVPLFDADCNTRICEHIVKDLSSEENLKRLPLLHSSMNEKFLKFVMQCMYFDDENFELVKIGRLLPYPRINLAFENGKVCYWNGK